MTFKLFISHSSRIDDGAVGVPAQYDFTLVKECSRLIREAYGKTVEVLVDYDIRCGDDWERNLNLWLGECHAALILCSPRAVKASDYVKKEVAVLTWRREWERHRASGQVPDEGSGIKLIPVLLDGMKSEDLQSGFFGTLKISTSQCREAVGADGVLNAVKEVLGKRAKLRPPAGTPLDALSDSVRQIIAESVSVETLQNVVQAIAPAENTSVTPPENCVKFYSTEIARYLLRDGDKALQRFISILVAMRPRPLRERAEELLKSVRALWVHAGAAAMLPAARHRPELIALNGGLVCHVADDGLRSGYTLERYKERAWPDADAIKVITISNLKDIEEIRDEIRRRYAPSAPKRNVDRWIRQSPRAILVLIKPPTPELPDDRLCAGLIQLKQEYEEKLIFVISSGPYLPEHEQQGVRFVRPALDPETEWDRQHDENDCWDTINTKYGAGR